MRKCIKCNGIFNDYVLFCPDDGELVILGAVLKGTYSIEEMLGEGGMAMVFRAKNVLNNTVCAIKIIHPDMVESEINAVERLLLEALKIKKINHPNVVKVLDFGPIHDGELVYLTMELLTGRTLKKEIQEKGYLDLKKVGSIVEQISAGMEEAHQKGIIHRDIKSENIFLLDNIKNNISIKILDFGISSDQNSGFTASHHIIGTPEYMSPEQCEGKTLDARSDIYSLGVTIYEMLAGNVPFPTSIFDPIEIVKRQMFKYPRPLSKYRNDVPKDVEEVLFKALEKNPDKRQQSILELAEEFDFALRQSGIIKERTESIKFDVKDLALNCINQGLFHLEHNEYAFAVNCFEEAINYDFNNTKAYYHCGVAYQAMIKLDEAIYSFNRAIEINPDYSEAYYSRGNVYFFKGNYELAIEDYSQAINTTTNNINSYLKRGMTYLSKNQLDKAISDFSQVIKVDPDHDQAYFGRGNAYCHKGDYELAIMDLSEAIELNSINIVDSYVLRAFSYKMLDKLDIAIIDCNKALSIAPQSANAYFVRSLVYQAKAASDQEMANKLKSPEDICRLSSGFLVALLKEIEIEVES
ncbi:MAG: tetratricopeptide repeat protein [Acidobacteria bacterium]|nr:tetratricopeptide repeat protein [Acidobacteriota bacterium]